MMKNVGHPFVAFTEEGDLCGAIINPPEGFCVTEEVKKWYREKNVTVFLEKRNERNILFFHHADKAWKTRDDVDLFLYENIPVIIRFWQEQTCNSYK